VILRLVSSGDDRALAIRDRVLPLIRRKGILEVQRDAVRLSVLDMPPWVFRCWTPFSALFSGEASSPGYRHAIERQRTRPDLPYGLEAWHDTEVLRVLWADDGAYEVTRFIRGPWEAAALLL
jgi:hypothetical protein